MKAQVVVTLDQTKAKPELVATFFYDPYLVNLIKQMPARKFDPVTKQWRMPYSLDTYRELVRKFGPALQPAGELRDLMDAEEARVQQAVLIKRAGDGVVADYVYCDPQPYAHQRMGHRLLDVNPRFALWWEQGTGKTRTVVDDFAARKQRGEPVRPALVFCPNEVKWPGWEDQVRRWSNGKLSVEVLEGSVDKRRRRLAESDADVLVLNVESALYLRNELLDPMKMRGVKQWPYVILDEVTRFKNPQAKRTKTLFKMPMAIIRELSGTPITNSPVDAYAPVTILDPGLFGSWFHFKDQYLRMGGYDAREIVGYKNLDELTEKVMRYGSRVLKAQVLDLPPKTYFTYDVLLEEETLKHYESMRDQMRTEWTSHRGDSGEVRARLAITQLLRLLQISGGLLQEGDEHVWLADNPKLKSLTEIVADLPPTEKIVVFAMFRTEIEELGKFFHELNPVLLYGGTPLAKRAEGIAKFQDKVSDTRMLIAQIHSGGIGITLTAAQTAVYYTRGWSLEDYLQSQDRLHRIGQTGTVNIIHLTAKLPPKIIKGVPRPVASIDEVITKVLTGKQTVADLITGDRPVASKEIEAIMEGVLG